MRDSKARAGHRAGEPCHRRWSAYGTSRVYRGAPSHTRGGSRMPELGTYGSVRGARGNSRPYRDHCSALALTPVAQRGCALATMAGAGAAQGRLAVSRSFHSNLKTPADVATMLEGTWKRYTYTYFAEGLIVLAVLLSAARRPRASFSASSFAQKCRKNSLGSSSSMWL